MARFLNGDKVYLFISVKNFLSIQLLLFTIVLGSYRALSDFLKVAFGSELYLRRLYILKD